jgi:hypothetical protein
LCWTARHHIPDGNALSVTAVKISNGADSPCSHVKYNGLQFQKTEEPESKIHESCHLLRHGVE